VDLTAFNEPFLLGISVSQIWNFVNPFLAALGGGYVVLRFDRAKAKESHRLTLDYEAEVAARSVRREKLLEAYELIDAALPDRLSFLELDAEEAFERTKLAGRGMGLVKLFGSENLCESVDKYVEMLNGNGNFNSSDFMNDFRDELRGSYGLKTTASRYRWVDFMKKNIKVDRKLSADGPAD
jgi:hypothetical protein